MRSYLALFSCIFFPLASHANTCLDKKDLIIRDLYNDEEYRNFTCGDEKCTPDTISTRISLETIDLGKSLTGCFATPTKKAENYYIGFYLIQNNKANQQFIFFGSYLCKTKTIKNGHHLITGEERIDSENKERYIFKWNGKNYISTSAKLRKRPEDLICQ